VKVKGIAIDAGAFGDSLYRDFFVWKFSYHFFEYCADCFFYAVEASIAFWSAAFFDPFFHNFSVFLCIFCKSVAYRTLYRKMRIGKRL